MAPECCDRKLKSNLYQYIATVQSFSGKAVDVWALGVTLFCMLYNKLPFYDQMDYLLFEKIHKEELKIPEDRQISPGLRSLMLSMLEKDPAKRATTESLRKNEWLNEGSKHPLTEEE